MPEHLSDDEMDLYCRGAADDAALQGIERHLLECADCARRVYETVRQLVRERRAQTQ